MLSELGLFALLLAMLFALLQVLSPLLLKLNSGFELVQKRSANSQLLMVAVAYLILTYAFVSNDFSFVYVTRNSASDLPLFYQISAVWSSHEGSLLLWSLILALWTCCLGNSNSPNPKIKLYSLACLGLISLGFYLFIVFTSSPFVAVFPPAPEGQSLNPLLQDPGLAIHPPLLYAGYVALAVPFALVIASLLANSFTLQQVKLIRAWVLIAWFFLTCGITLGSWWAYHELGWGGWWFWDPVENASFLPWIISTALLHSLAVNQARLSFKKLSILLAISAFALSLLGTFLVRSGILNSVHAFASDPQRGVFLLIFLALIVGGALLIYALRAPVTQRARAFDWLSRESFLLLNNALLLAMAATVLLGTLYPLLVDVALGEKLSVGEPYFNAVFAPLGMLLALTLGFGVHSTWRNNRGVSKAKKWFWGLAVLLSLLAVLLFYQQITWLAILGLMMACWVFINSARSVIQRLKQGTFSWSFGGMSLAHLGLAVFIVGVTISNEFKLREDIQMVEGQRVKVGNQQIIFNGIKLHQRENYLSQTAYVSLDGYQLYPEKRRYLKSGTITTESAVQITWWGDIYLTLGNELPDGSWSLRWQVKPMIRWIWGGALLMALGGGMSLIALRKSKKMANSEKSKPKLVIN